MEKRCLGLSIAIKYQYAIEKAGVGISMKGTRFPVSRETLSKAFEGVDKYLGFVYLPIRFRSTKHFTVNTPLGVTGHYNNVETDRNFIVIDDIDHFVNSGFAYSIAYHDAYLDLSHKSLPLSSNAVVLIEQGKYETLKQNKTLMEQLNGKKVVIFKGDEVLAIDMVLTELGVLPSQVGSLYSEYDHETRTIIEKSIKDFAHDHHLLFNKSHAGALSPNGGHFSNYYDNQNYDYDKAIDEFVMYLKEKFPNDQSLFTHKTIKDSFYAEKIVAKIGIEPLLNAINEFNEFTMKNFKERYMEYRKDRDSITLDIEQFFIVTIQTISRFFMEEVTFDSLEEKVELDEQIRLFLQADTVKEQLESAKIIIDVIGKKMAQRDIKENANIEEIISPHQL